MLEPLYDWVVLEPQYKTEIRKTPEFTGTYTGVWPWREPVKYENGGKEYEQKTLINSKVIAIGPGVNIHGVFIKPHIKIGDIIPDLPKYIHGVHIVDGLCLVQERYLPAVIRSKDE